MRVVFDSVVLDVDTQNDYVNDEVKPVVDWPLLRASMRRVVARVKRYHLPIISIASCFRQSEVPPGSPCIEGSQGQRKIGFTLFKRRIIVRNDGTSSILPDLLNGHQLIFQIRGREVLASPKLDSLISRISARRFFVFGIGIEHHIESLVLGLLARERSVSVISDACGYWNRRDADLSLKKMLAKGAELVTVKQFISHALSSRRE